MKIGQIIQIVVIAILVTALVIGNVIVFEPQMASNITGLQAYFEEVLNFHPFAANTNTINEARKGGQELSEQIIKEGSVRMLPVAAPANTTADRLVEMVPDVLDKVSSFIDSHTKNNEA